MDLSKLNSDEIIIIVLFWLIILTPVALFIGHIDYKMLDWQ